MCIRRHTSAGYHLMIGSLLDQLWIIRKNTCRHKAAVYDGVDLIKSQPVLHFILVAFKYRVNIPLKAVDGSAVCPSIPRGGQSQRCFVMAQGHDWFNAILPALVKNSIVKSQSFFVRSHLLPGRVDPAPCNGHPIALEPHFGKQRNIFFVVMIKVTCLHGGVILVFHLCRNCTVFGIRHGFQGNCGTFFFSHTIGDISHFLEIFGVLRWHTGKFHRKTAHAAAGLDICRGKPFSAFQSGTFHLICCGCTAPQKVFG